jgi:hypothetical protein
MGAQPGVEDARGRVAYSHNGGRFMITKPIDGGTSIEDPPSKRPNGAYLAYLRDPDGHNPRNALHNPLYHRGRGKGEGGPVDSPANTLNRRSCKRHANA